MRSYASGPSTRPLTGQTIGEAVAATAARLPDGLALVSRHQDVGQPGRIERRSGGIDQVAAGIDADR